MDGGRIDGIIKKLGTYIFPKRDLVTISIQNTFDNSVVFKRQLLALTFTVSPLKSIT